MSSRPSGSPTITCQACGGVELAEGVEPGEMYGEADCTSLGCDVIRFRGVVP